MTRETALTIMAISMIFLTGIVIARDSTDTSVQEVCVDRD